MRLQTATYSKQCGLEASRHQGFVKAVPSLSNLQALTEIERAEVLEFLQKRPVHTVVMMSFIEDNGLESADNRGTFYGYRNSQGTLEGVALIGHTTLIESRSEDALLAFALKAKTSETPIHIMMSDGNTTERFWQFYAAANQKPRLVCTELLFELNFPFLVQDCNWEIRQAKVEELDQIAEAHAEVAFIESGVNPLEKDREGFLKRTLRRIEKERTFVVFDNGKLVFKADIVAETSDVVYLEGIYVAPEYRGQGVGSSCLSKLSLELLNRAQHICLLSNVEFKGAHRSFLKAGYKNTDSCQTIFV
jgi:GNAT superfamily N-acetyltransferase